MRLLAACSLGGAGHLRPLVPFLDAAKRQGHDAMVVGPPALRELVEQTGHRFQPGEEPTESQVAPIRERLPVVPPQEGSVLGNCELFGRLATSAMLAPMEEICAEWKPDIILREPCEYASAIVALRLGIPTAQVAISLADAEWGSIDAAAPALEDHRSGLVEELRALLYLTRFPATLDLSPFASTIRFREVDAGSAGSLPDWWAALDAPLIYATFGTVLGHMSIAPRVYRTALKALSGLDVRVLLTVGRQFDPTPLGPIPTNVHVAAWVDQADVLTHADMVLCHGGSGTAFAALAAGLPLVVVPVFADQFQNGRRIAEQGAGLLVERQPGDDGSRPVINELDAPRIAEAITEVMATPCYRQQARRIAAEMAAVPTADEVLATLAAKIDGTTEESS